MKEVSSLVGSANYVSVIVVSDFEFIWNLVLVIWNLSCAEDKTKCQA